MLWSVKDFTKRDAETLFGTMLHPLLERAIPEYVSHVKKSMFNYSNIRLYWDEQGAFGPVHVMMDNYRVGKVDVVTVGSTYKLRVIPAYVVVSDPTPTVSAPKTAQYMVTIFRMPTPDEDGRDMVTKTEKKGYETERYWDRLVRDKANDASTKASGVLHSGGMAVVHDALLTRIARLLNMASDGTSVSLGTLQNVFGPWIEEGTFDAMDRHKQIQKLHAEFKHASNAPHSMYVREWSDGTGAIVKAEGTEIVRHMCTNLREQMPAEYASKLAVLKVSGMDCVPDVGICGGTRKLTDELTESVYYLI
jgi:hypothetical protein